MPEVLGANVIETKNVIRMAVCNQDCVEMSETNSESLLSEIAGGVNDDCLPGVLNQDRHAQTLVTRIVRRARFAIASDGRNARRCAGAEKR
jgi:hypothetical protein